MVFPNEMESKIISKWYFKYKIFELQVMCNMTATCNWYWLILLRRNRVDSFSAELLACLRIDFQRCSAQPCHMWTVDYFSDFLMSQRYRNHMGKFWVCTWLFDVFPLKWFQHVKDLLGHMWHSVLQDQNYPMFHFYLCLMFCLSFSNAL